MATAFAGAGGTNYNTTAGDKTSTLAGATIGDQLVIAVGLTGVTTAPTVTDDNSSGTYTEVTGGVLKGTSADGMWVFVRNALVPATVSTIITMTSPGGDTGGGVFVYRLTGMARAGASAVRQVAKQQNQAAATPAPVFGVAPLTGNSLLGAVNNATNPATMTAPTSWTEKHDGGYITPTTGLETATIDSGFTSTTVTWGSASGSAFSSVAVEMDGSAAPAGADPFPFVGDQGYYPT